MRHQRQHTILCGRTSLWPQHDILGLYGNDSRVRQDRYRQLYLSALFRLYGRFERRAFGEIVLPELDGWCSQGGVEPLLMHEAATELATRTGDARKRRKVIVPEQQIGRINAQPPPRGFARPQVRAG